MLRGFKVFALVAGLSATLACASPLAPTASISIPDVTVPQPAPTHRVFTPALPPGRPRVILECPDGTIPVLHDGSPACQLADDYASGIWRQ